MARSIAILLYIILVVETTHAQPHTDTFLQNILRSDTNSILRQVLKDPQTYRLQVIYTQINRDKNNHPTFKNFYFNYDPNLYFNPASTVKLPLAFLALEKLNKMHVPGVTKYTSMQFDSSYERQVALIRDSTSANQQPSIAHFIKRAFLISENDPYNRLYQFVGQQSINNNLHLKGYPGIRITRQFMGYNAEQNRHTNAIRFIQRDGRLIYLQPAAYNIDTFDFSHDIKIGRGYRNRSDSLVNEPFDFTAHNNLSLEDLRKLLQSVLFPGTVPSKQRFQLNPADYQFLYRYLSQYPSETSYPKYNDSLFYDSYVKFFFRDRTHKMPAQVRIFNKVGWAYGFLTDVSYVADFKNKIEYMLSATIYVNKDGVLNDDQYEYEEAGWPFLYLLGQRIYQYDLHRKRQYPPDLRRFKINYEKRDPTDKRTLISEVDN